LTVLGSAEEVEVILIDDRSDAESGIPPLFERFREQVSSPTRLLLLTERQYYTYACSLGLSVAKGEFVLFLSHDMVAPPAYVRALLRAAAADEAFGIIRGTSPHVDCMPQHVIAPPLRCRNYRDVCAFAEYVAAYHGDEIVEDRFLVGDSFLVKRSVIEKIGVMDLRYQHLFGDLDFGVRAARAGFKLVCVRGAWLLHDGAGHTKSSAAAGVTLDELANEARTLVSVNYAAFRNRWGAFLPVNYPGASAIDFERICEPPRQPDEFAPLIHLPQSVVREL
jgi:GT2 family glycosyltransferase